MLKGSQKQMIVIRTGDSRYFDEAYFVLRREIKTHRVTQSDMISEANRILRESQLEPPISQKQKKRRGLLLFLAGICCGGLLAALVCLLLV